MSEELKSLIKKYFTEQETVDLIKKLVVCPSHEGVENQETDVARHINEFFINEGIESEMVSIVDGRCNVVAKLRGKGNGKSLLFTGHTDTVPPYDMQGDPYKIRISDGKMYGRGVVDMKAGLACMMMAMASLKRAGIKLSGDLIFAGVIDEEAKSEGTRALLESGIKTDAAIVSEPTNMEICIAHRGLEWFEFTFHGKTVHGGKQKEGINAIQKAMKFINKMECDLIPEIEKRTIPILGSSSMNYGLIRGGTQPSTVAGECILQIDRRWIPGEEYSGIIREYQEILDDLHKEDPHFKADFKVMEISYMDEKYIHEAMYTDAKDMIVEVSQKALIEVTGEKPELRSFTAWTDGGLINSYGKIPTIVLGPGDLESAHSAEEHLAISSVVPATIIYALIACNYCE